MHLQNRGQTSTYYKLNRQSTRKSTNTPKVSTCSYYAILTNNWSEVYMYPRPHFYFTCTTENLHFIIKIIKFWMRDSVNFKTYSVFADSYKCYIEWWVESNESQTWPTITLISTTDKNVPNLSDGAYYCI